MSHLRNGIGVIRDDGRELAVPRHTERTALNEVTDADVFSRRQTTIDEQAEIVQQTTRVAGRFQAAPDRGLDGPQQVDDWLHAVMVLYALDAVDVVEQKVAADDRVGR